MRLAVAIRDQLYKRSAYCTKVIGLNPRVGGKADTDDSNFDVCNLSVGVFHHFNREYAKVPAFAIRGDLGKVGSSNNSISYR